MTETSLKERDAKLLAQLADGDMRASREIMRLYLDQAFRTAYRITADTGTAEDITQEAFLKLWKAAGKWEARARISTWLHPVIHNLAIDHLRKQKRLSGDEVPEQEDQSPNPFEAKAEAELQKSVRSGVTELPPRQRLAITLVHFDECSGSEAAGRMGITVEALESLLSRGRRKLKDLLSLDQLKLRGDGR
ncbi:MAG: sigma-70 family RNA polymerase sigma factor [Sneathiella sp.]|nr:sigma-70 family RNA polymerase sigma factor [Sneathiella sp.]